MKITVPMLSVLGVALLCVFVAGCSSSGGYSGGPSYYHGASVYYGSSWGYDDDYRRGVYDNHNRSLAGAKAISNRAGTRSGGAGMGRGAGGGGRGGGGRR